MRRLRVAWVMSLPALLVILLFSASAAAAPEVLLSPSSATCVRRLDAHPPATAKRVKESMAWLAEQTCRRFIVPSALLERPLAFSPDETALELELELDCLLARAGFGEKREQATLLTDTPPRPIEELITCDGPRRCSTTRAKLEELLGHMSELSRAARIVPAMKDGRASGFKLYGMRPGSFFDKLGFQKGDVVVTINDLTMDSPEKALAIFTGLRAVKQIRLGIERAGAPLDVVLDVRER